MKLACVFTIISCLLFASCGTVDRTDVLGTWAVEYSFGVEVLQLRDSRDYLQVIILNDSVGVTTHTGQWSYDSHSNYVKLENALAIQSAFGELEDRWDVPFEGLVLARARRLLPWSAVELQSSKEGLAFSKLR